MVRQNADSKVYKALSHPLRMKIMAILSEGEASPSDLAERLGEPLGNVAYHTKTLVDLDCIELTRTAPRRGALEHYYRATVRPFLTQEQWAQLPAASRRSISAGTLSEIWRDASAAVESKTFDSRPDRHLSWTNLALDEQGWEAVADLLKDTLERLLELQADAAARLQGADPGEITSSKVVLMHYEAAPVTADAKTGRSRRTAKKSASRTRAKASTKAS
jgi:DNA-binding transcriptional ArsR family regulator